MAKKGYFCKDAYVLASILDFLEESKLVSCRQRFRIIRYLLRNADENGIVRTTYKKVVSDLNREKGDSSIELNTVGSTFRKLMDVGFITMTRPERGVKVLTEYQVQKKFLHSIVSKGERAFKEDSKQEI